MQKTVLSLCFVFLSVSAVLALDPPRPKEGGIDAAQNPTTPFYLGQVVYVDPQTLTFTCKDANGNERNFSATGKTVVARMGTKTNFFSGVTVGSYATVRAVQNADGKEEIQFIGVELKPGRRFGYAGQIVAINPVKRMISCTKKNGKVRTLTITKDTLIERDGAKVGIEQIKVGDYASGRCIKIDEAVYELDSVRLSAKPMETAKSPGGAETEE